MSGGYLLFYWLPQLLGTTNPGDAGLAGLAGRVSTTITEHQLAVTLTAAALVLIAATAVISTRRAPARDASAAGADCCPPTDDTAHGGGVTVPDRKNPGSAAGPLGSSLSSSKPVDGHTTSTT